MAFKFKTKKRPSLGQAIAGGFAQGVSAGLKEGAERSLQDRLDEQEAFKNFRKDFSQSINYIDVNDEDRKILRNAQSMMLMGTLKNKNEVVTHLNAKSPNLGFKITGASAPQVIGSSTGGYSTLQFVNGKPVINKLTDPVENPYMLRTTSPEGVTTLQAVPKKSLTTPVVTKTSKPSKEKTVEEKQLDSATKEVIENATEEGLSIEDYMIKYDGQPEVELYKQLQGGNQEVVSESTNVQPQAMEGMTIINPSTGERLILKDGQWQPIK
jgi:hypothetical protein